jgi:HSP20 family protein
MEPFSKRSLQFSKRSMNEEVLMAEVAVKRAEEKKDEKALTQQSQGGLSRQGFWEPFSWWNPSEFFSNPFALMRRFSEEMDRTFARFFTPREGEGFWSPAVEVSESDGQLKVHADLPGLEPRDVRVEVDNNELIIRGERKFEHEEKKKGYYRSERRYGQFYRAIPLPEGANLEQVKAQFKNGVLEVTLPVPEQKSTRREIPIQSD